MDWRTGLPGLWLLGTAVWWAGCGIAILDSPSRPREPVTLMFSVPGAALAIMTALSAGWALMRNATHREGPPIDRAFWFSVLIAGAVAVVFFFCALIAYEVLEPPRRSNDFRY